MHSLALSSINEAPRDRSATRVVVLVLGVLATVVIAWLAVDNARLRRPASRELVLPAARTQLKVGDRLEDHMLAVASGEPMDDERSVTLYDVTRGGAVLFFFTTRCPYCLNSVQHVERIASNLGPTVPVIGIALDGQNASSEVISRFARGFEVLVPADIRAAAQLRLNVVPTTILLDARRTISRVWVGELTDEHVAAATDLARAMAE